MRGISGASFIKAVIPSVRAVHSQRSPPKGPITLGIRFSMEAGVRDYRRWKQTFNLATIKHLAGIYYGSA